MDTHEAPRKRPGPRRLQVYLRFRSTSVDIFPKPAEQPPVLRRQMLYTKYRTTFIYSTPTGVPQAHFSSIKPIMSIDIRLCSLIA